MGRLRRLISRLRRQQESGVSARDLRGDRDLEWSFGSARAGRYVDASSSVLDFGCGSGFLTLSVGSAGARVLGIDLMPRQFALTYPTIAFRKTDVVDLPDDERFDVILNCSTIEHVGLGGRYGASEATDGDIAAMRKMLGLLKPNGHMVLTLPVGRDAVIYPLHRIYGSERLPRLLQGYRTIESTFVRKGEDNEWTLCDEETAFVEEGTKRYYAIGMFVLQRAARR